MKIILFCWNCGEEYNSSELPDMQLYYKGEVDSLYFSCNKCDGQVRS